MSMKRSRDSLPGSAEARKAKRQRQASPSDSEREDGAPDTTSREFVRAAGLKLYDAARIAQDEYGRTIAADFMKVPSKKTYPDYYEVIKHPVALDDIKQLLDKDAFPSLKMVKDQFDQCFKNARKYNMKASQIWLDSKTLQKIVNSEYKKLMGEDDDDDGSDAEDKKEKKKNIARTMKNRLQKLTQKTDENGRVLSVMFMELPNRKEWAFYYKQIKNPICFNQISKRVKQKSYADLDAFAADVNLIFDNAMLFNAEDSQIYEDAVLLKEYFRQLCAADHAPPAEPKIKLKVPVAPPPVKQPPKEETLPSTLNLHVPTKAVPTPTPAPSLPPAPVRAPSPKLPVAPLTVSKPKAAPAPTPAPKAKPQIVHHPVPVPIPAPPPPPPRIPPMPYHYMPLPQQPPSAAPTPPPAPKQTAPPPPVYKYATPDPPAEAKHPIAAAILQTLPVPGGRTWKLSAREGVRTWSVRLGRGEKRVRLGKLRYQDIEESDDDDEERETQVKLNGKPIDPAAEGDNSGWEKELITGMNTLEFGAKGGELWKVYLDCR